MSLKRTVVQIEILYNDESVATEALEDVSAINYFIHEGDASGVVSITEDEEVTKEKMAELLEAQGSDPCFLLGEEWEDEEQQRRDEKNGLYSEHLDDCN